MENNANQSDQKNTPNTEYSYYQPKKKPVLLIVLTIVLAITVVILAYTYYKSTQDAKATEQLLEGQKNDLTNQLNSMYYEYDSLKTENDTMNVKLEKQQARIKSLLTVNASNLEKIQLYQKELTTLREVMKSYIIQIDSLNQRNQALTAENYEVKGQLQLTTAEKEEISKQRDELSTKVDQASVLSAKDVLAVPLNNKSKEKYNPDKIAKIRVCFTVRENAIVAPGSKNVYIRILRPDDVVLANPSNDVISVKGQNVVYSAKRQLEYENKDIELCIFWDKTSELIVGTYRVEIYCESNLIGTTTFALK